MLLISSSYRTDATHKHDNVTRNCNFPGERQLEYFVNYTKSNCETEFNINYFNKKCNCVPYYLPGLSFLRTT